MVVNRLRDSSKTPTLKVYSLNSDSKESLQPAKFLRKQSSYPVFPQPAAATQRTAPTSNMAECPAPEPAPYEKITGIRVKGKSSSFILERLIEVTNAKIVEPPPADQKEIAKFKASDQRREKLREVARQAREKRRKEEAIMKSTTPVVVATKS